MCARLNSLGGDIPALASIREIIKFFVSKNGIKFEAGLETSIDMFPRTCSLNGARQQEALNYDPLQPSIIQASMSPKVGDFKGVCGDPLQRIVSGCDVNYRFSPSKL